uniref:Serine/threonine-protein kinase At1g01540 family n=1 Tax=Cajanus cajan TaxID=3821 RepID=A0A151RQF3_CAJCA|nr:putative serine/threonine-protein kinase At1g01540 family [Cajanus cajan]
MPGNNLHDIANEVHLDAQLLERYNHGVNFSKESGIVFIPGRGSSGPTIASATGLPGIMVAKSMEFKTAIKKMDVQASTEFLCELKVLTHVHHLNLVHLIGYCVEGSLFLVYEYIDNGNLGQYLHGTGKDTLPWSSLCFEEALNQINPAEGTSKLVDPRLGENYPIDSVLKIAQLLRPSMRSIVVALMTLSSPTEDCEDDASYENQTHKSTVR